MTDEITPPATPVRRLSRVMIPPEEQARLLAEQAEDAGTDPLQTRMGWSFAQNYHERFCFDHGLEQWMVWNGSIWTVDTSGLPLYEMMQFGDRLIRVHPTARRQLSSVGFCRGALEAAAHDRRMARAHDEFDNAPSIIATPKGYIDLETGEVRQPDRSLNITRSTAISPEPGPCPMWMNFLAAVHKGQEEIIDWLQKLCGEALLGRQTDHHFVFFYGDGGNGKSQFLETLSGIMGDYAAQAQAGTFTQPEGRSFGGQHEHVLAMLEGARLVLVSEPGDGEQWNMGRVKQWTGGGMITADLKYKAAQTFRPAGLLVLESNKALKVEVVNNAVARRLRYVVWPHKFAGTGYEHLKIDDLALKMLAEEGPQIFSWMIEGAQRVLREGLRTTPEIERTSASYLKEQDVDQRFIEDCLEVDEHVQPGVDLQDAVTVYNEWARNTEAPARKNIGTRMVSKGLEVSKSHPRRYIRKHSLSANGMAYMSAALMRRIRSKELTKTDAERWRKTLLEWDLKGDDGAYVNDLLGVAS